MSQHAIFGFVYGRIFVLADPEIFTGSLAQVVSADIEAASASSPVDHMCSVVQHSIQAALGEQCLGPVLANTLKVSATTVIFTCVFSCADLHLCICLRSQLLYLLTSICLDLG